MFDVALSGVFDVRAATRYRLQYDEWHRYEPPRVTFVSPFSGPTGLSRVITPQSTPHQSLHHSQMLPAMQ